METKRKMITEKECYGCMLCVNQCPVDAIGFREDDCGFIYPNINVEKCINCGKCEKTCIANNPPKIKKTEDRAYSASLNRSDLLQRSASGGAAYGLGIAHLLSGGVVYGVAYSEGYQAAEYVRVSTVEELSRLQDTKYFHAAEDSKARLFSQVAEDLRAGWLVLVIGLPCEIAALRKLFGENEKLILVELFCHGVTSSAVHRRYIKTKTKGKMVVTFSVKNKQEGWKKNSLIRIEMDDGTVFHEPFYSSDYGYAFTNLSRRSCYECHYKGDQRVADISIGDYWGVLLTGKSYNKNGVSAIQVHTEKGQKLLLQCNDCLKMAEISRNDALADNVWVENTIPKENRAEYSKKFAAASNIYVPLQMKIKKTINEILGRY